MKYVVYKVTNLINHKEYIGVHKTSDINDGYLGSGTLIKAAVNKYGKENFYIELLEEYLSKKEAYDHEKSIVTPSYVADPNTYNIKEGGQGGFDHTHTDPAQIEKRRAGNRLAVLEGRQKPWNKHDTYGFKGKTHTKEARKKISEARSLEESIVISRLEDYNQIEKKWGWKSKLAKQWNVSHTQVNRFIKDYLESS